MQYKHVPEWERQVVKTEMGRAASRVFIAWFGIMTLGAGLDGSEFLPRVLGGALSAGYLFALLHILIPEPEKTQEARKRGTMQSVVKLLNFGTGPIKLEDSFWFGIVMFGLGFTWGYVFDGQIQNGLFLFPMWMMASCVFVFRGFEHRPRLFSNEKPELSIRED